MSSFEIKSADMTQFQQGSIPTFKTQIRSNPMLRSSNNTYTFNYLCVHIYDNRNVHTPPVTGPAPSRAKTINHKYLTRTGWLWLALLNLRWSVVMGMIRGPLNLSYLDQVPSAGRRQYASHIRQWSMQYKFNCSISEQKEKTCSEISLMTIDLMYNLEYVKPH